MIFSTSLANTRRATASDSGARAARSLTERDRLRPKTKPFGALFKVACETNFATGKAVAHCLSVESSRRLA